MSKRKINTNGANIIYWRIGKGGVIEVLIQKSANRPRKPWEVPGGEMEYGKGETFPQAALRESGEEIGHACHPSSAKFVGVFQQLKILAELPDAYVVGMVAVFAAFGDIDPDSLTLQLDEVCAARWCPIEEALRAEDDGRDEWVGLSYRRMLAHFFNHLSTGEIYTCDLGQSVDVVTSDGILTI